MLKQILSKFPRKPKSESLDSTGSDSGNNSPNLGSGFQCTIGGSSLTSKLNVVKRVSSAVFPASISAGAEVVEPHLSFKEVSNPQKQNLFISKLNVCCEIIDSSDPAKQDLKRETLIELVDFVSSGSAKFNEPAISAMCKMCATNLFRVFPPKYRSNFTGGETEDEEPMFDPAWSHLQIVYDLLVRFISYNSLDIKVAKKHVDHSFIVRLLDLFDSEDPRERDCLKTILHRIYGKFMVHRPFIRKAVSNIIYRFVFETERHNGMSELLEIFGSVISGFALPLKEEHKIFLWRALIPLHKPKSVGIYHQQLTYCVVQFIEKDPKLASTVIKGLLKYWPVTNSQKELMFLSELEEVLEMTSMDEFQKIMVPLFRRIRCCLNSSHYQVAERAHLLWNNEHILNLIGHNRQVILPLVFPAIERNTQNHWNQAVLNLTMNVRKMFCEMDEELVLACQYKLEEEHIKSNSVSSSPPLTKLSNFLSKTRSKFWVWVFLLNWVLGCVKFRAFSEMEVSVVRSSRVNIGRAELGRRELGFCKLSGNLRTQISFGQNTSWKNGRLQFTLRAVQSESVRPVKASGPSKRSNSNDGLRLFVGLPLDAVSDCNSVKHARAIAVGLMALKLLGVTGVELPVWWGIVEKEAMGKYEWSAYHSLAEMVQKAGLELHVSLCFHASKQPKISLPDWVSCLGESQPGMFFKDRSGQQFKECLSLAVDELPVLNGKTPIQVYHDFCESFKASFSPFLGSTITGVSVSLGPDGELRYPSHHQSVKRSKIPGVGEFQCFDENMLSALKQHAEATGNPLWGLGGPHDAPSYDQSPDSNTFFKDHGGSWESPYGDFFLSWYSNQLISHGDRILSLASSTFGDTEVTVYGKVPLMHSWYKTRSHPSELTSGFYNTSSRDGYEAVADMFARNSCKMILPGLDLSDVHQPHESRSSPESLLSQIRTACKKHGIEISGQNSSISGAPGGFQQIKKNLLGENKIDLFTYQRMGAYFFSPEHFPSFSGFVRSLNQVELQSDDLASDEEATESIHVNSEPGIHMQAA